MNKNTIRSLQFIALLLAGAGLVFLSLSKLQLADLASLLKKGNYRVAVPVYMVSLSGYYFRVLRWKLLYRSMGEEPRKSMLFASLCVGYFVSFAVPRLGELTRCAMLKKADAVPFNRSLISIVAERTVDLLTLLLLLLFVLIFNTAHITFFIKEYIIAPVMQQANLAAIVFVVSGLLVILFALRWFMKQQHRNRKVYRFYLSFMQSVQNILLMKQRLLFLGLTILIWFCYFLMTYLWLFTFTESAHLGIKAAFIVMVIGSIGRSVPVQGGGMGAYHFLVSNAFALFGLSLLTGNALAIVIHGAQAVFTFFTGILCLLWFLFQLKKQKFEA